jgi:predicted transcriptional regulator
MKSTTIPPLRVSPELRREAESVLQEGETLSGFMLESLQGSIARRRDQRAFLQRGLKSAAKARRTGRYVGADDVLDGLSARLKKAEAKPGG